MAETTKDVFFWRRLDIGGMERAELSRDEHGLLAASTVICVEAGGFRLDYHWRLDHDWRTQHVTVERWNREGHALLHLERNGTGWHVDGARRADLEGAEEPDLSVTPFSNTAPIRRVPQATGADLTLDVAYIDGPALAVSRSRQRYVRQAPGRLRYADLGTTAGFEADLEADAEGIVLGYEKLFKRVPPA